MPFDQLTLIDLNLNNLYGKFIVGFVLNQEFSLGLYRKYSDNWVDGVKEEPLKAAETRFASKFLLICRAVDVHNNFERMVVDPEYRLDEQTPKVKHGGVKTKREIQSTSLWTCNRYPQSIALGLAMRRAS